MLLVGWGCCFWWCQLCYSPFSDAQWRRQWGDFAPACSFDEQEGGDVYPFRGKSPVYGRLLNLLLSLTKRPRRKMPVCDRVEAVVRLGEEPEALIGSGEQYPRHPRLQRERRALWHFSQPTARVEREPRLPAAARSCMCWGCVGFQRARLWHF